LTRQRLANAKLILGLLGLGILFYGGAFYPPLAWPMAIANLLYLAALALAWTVGRIARRLHERQRFSR
jgi:hypothetical protein